MSRRSDRQTLAAVCHILLLLELPHDAQDDSSLPLGEADNFAQYGTYSLVSKRLHQLLVEEY